MDSAGIQARIDRGAAIATRYLGTPYTWYRPAGTGNPLATPNIVGMIHCNFKADFAFKGRKPSLYGSPVFAVLFDRTNSLPGDYLDGKEGTFFLIAQQLHAPAAAVSCNRVLTFYRPGAAAPGSAYYGGDYAATETVLATAWPASVRQSSRGTKPDAGLPSDVALQRQLVLLPPSFPKGLRSGDVIVDDYARRFVVSDVEQTDLGYRVIASAVAT